MVERGKDCAIIATANTYGLGADRVYVGRNQLDGATLDRFIVIDVDYDEALEMALATAEGATPEQTIAVLSLVRQLRNQAKASSLKCIFGMRSSINACALLAAGETDGAFVLNSAIRRGISDRDWQTLGSPTLQV